MSDLHGSKAITLQTEAPPASPLLTLHRALRGRYPIALIAAFLAGIMGAGIGWLATKPLYTSQGWIRAFPRQPRVLYETEDNQMMPMFEAFVKSQADLLRSRRVIDLALSEPSLRDSAWPAPPAGVRKLIEALEVTASRGSELISVSVSHEDPLAAQVAANAMLTAFMKYQEEQDGMTATERERRLRDNQQLLNSELKTIRESMIRMSDQFGGADPEVLVMSKTEQLARIESQVADFAVIPGADRISSSTPAPAPAAQASAQDLAKTDSLLASLLAQRQELLVSIDAKSARLGPRHVEMRALRERLDSLEVRIASRTDELRESLSAQPLGAAPGAPTGDPATVARHYESLRDKLASDIRELSRARMEMRSLREREDETQKRLAETSKALDVIRVENEVIRGGRVRIQQRAATPVDPTKDRRLPLAVGGLLAGSGGVIGCFVLASLVRRQLRFADELESIDQMLPLIGVIPEAGSSGPVESQSIALALHHVRNSLLLFRKPQQSGGSVYLVTSAAPGEGKTTLAIALGTSFAQAGYRTAIVDGDFVGRGMTRELSIADRPGFTDSLKLGTPDMTLHTTHVQGLVVLPAGTQRDYHAHQVTVEEMAPVIERLRSTSDIVVIDTGPILGSLEAGLLSQLSDTVIIVAAKGTGTRQVDAALDRIRSLCRCGVALVFNRADYRDMSTSASYSSVHSRVDNEVDNPAPSADRGRLLRILASKDSGHPGNGVSM